MRLGVEQHDARKDERRADGADDKVLERRFERALLLAAEGRQTDRAEGHNLDHDVHIEDVARQHHAENAAGGHQKQGVILHLVRVMLDIIDAVQTRGEGRDADKQTEEQAERIDLKRDADGVASGDAAAAHPVGDYLAV